MDPLIALFGLGVGILVGMTGMGGAAIMTPMLILVFGIKPAIAVGTDIAYGAITKTVGGISHFRLKTVNARLTMWLAFGSVPAGLGGVYLLHALEKQYGSGLDGTLMSMIAVALLIVGGGLFVRTLLMPHGSPDESHEVNLTTGKKIAAVATGALTGFVVGLTSAGSGFLIAVSLILIFRLLPKYVVGTDIFHAAILLWAAGIGNIIVGNVDYSLMGSILIGSIPGVWIGSHLSVRLPSGLLRTVLSVLIVSSSFALLQKAGLPISSAVLLAIPVGLLAVAGGLHFVRVRRGVNMTKPNTPAQASSRS